MLVERVAVGHAGDVVGDDARGLGAPGAIGLLAPLGRQTLRLGDEKLKQQENERMAKLYREVILKEKPVEAGFVPVSQLGGIQPAAPKAAPAKEKQEEVGSFGD